MSTLQFGNTHAGLCSTYAGLCGTCYLKAVYFVLCAPQQVCFDASALQREKKLARARLERPDLLIYALVSQLSMCHDICKSSAWQLVNPGYLCSTSWGM